MKEAISRLLEPEREKPADGGAAKPKAGGDAAGLYRTVSRVSKLVAALTGSGLLMLYVLGISLYAISDAIFGVPAFEFSLSRCLEQGASFMTQLVLVIPWFLLIGFHQIHFFSLWGVLLLLVPLLLLLLLKLLPEKRETLKAILACFLLLHVTAELAIGYVVNSFLLVHGNFLLDRAINTAIEAGPGADLEALGLVDFLNLQWTLMFGKPEEAGGLLGAVISLNLLAPVLAFLALKVAAPALKSGSFVSRFARRAGTVLKVAAGCYVVFLFFWLPAEVLFLTATRLPKVDASIPGLQGLTAEKYLILYAEHGDRYAFYAPTEQNVVLVAKDKVDHVVLKGLVSVFENRSVFRKGPWIGITYQVETGQRGGVVYPLGLEIRGVDIGGPAFKAGLAEGDLVLEIDGKGPKDLANDLPAVLRAAPRDRPVKVVIERGGKTMATEIRIEDRP